MLLSRIDYLASNGSSFLHKAKPWTKLLFAALAIAGVVVSGSFLELGVFIIIMIALFLIAGVKPKEILHFAMYPAFFSLVFAIYRMQYSIAAGFVIVFKAIGAALTMLLVITTTSYVEIFGVFSLFLPPLLVDIFFFAYRSFFILIDRLTSLLKSIRLRGGYSLSGLAGNLKNIAGAVGVMIIHSYDMSDRMYRIYSLRGYEGKIAFTRKWLPLTVNDLLVTAVAVLMLLWMVIGWNI